MKGEERGQNGGKGREREERGIMEERGGKGRKGEENGGN